MLNNRWREREWAKTGKEGGREGEREIGREGGREEGRQRQRKTETETSRDTERDTITHSYQTLHHVYNRAGNLLRIIRTFVLHSTFEVYKLPFECGLSACLSVM